MIDPVPRAAATLSGGRIAPDRPDLARHIGKRRVSHGRAERRFAFAVTMAAR
jgi:hypothetical protein